MTGLRRAAIALGIAFAGASSAHAHETWLVLSKTTDGKLVADVATGNRFPTSDNAVKPDRIEKAIARGGDSYVVSPMTNARVEGTVTRLDVPVLAAEQTIAGVALFPKLITIDAKKFEAYLKEIGATDALSERAHRGESAKPGREVYVKVPKAVPFAFGPTQPAPARTSLGLPLEFFFEGDVRDGAASEEGVGEGVARATHAIIRTGRAGRAPASIILLRKNQPVPGQLVRAWNGWGKLIFSGKTDSFGRVRVPLLSRGRVLVAATVMERLSDADKAQGEPFASADWRSFWASLSFEVP